MYSKYKKEEIKKYEDMISRIVSDAFVCKNKSYDAYFQLEKVKNDLSFLDLYIGKERNKIGNEVREYIKLLSYLKAKEDYYYQLYKENKK